MLGNPEVQDMLEWKADEEDGKKKKWRKEEDLK